MYYLLISYTIFDSSDCYSDVKQYHEHEIYFLESEKECNFTYSKIKYELELKYNNNNPFYYSISDIEYEINIVEKSKINYV